MKVQRLPPTAKTPFHSPEYRTEAEAAAEKTRRLKLTLPVPPPLNNLYATVRAPNGKMLRVKSERGKAYDATVKTLLAGRTFTAMDGPICLKLKVFRAQKSGDLDNFSKGVLDSLKGICWVDDKQIVYIESHREDDKKNPRVEIEIWEMK